MKVRERRRRLAPVMEEETSPKDFAEQGKEDENVSNRPKVLFDRGERKDRYTIMNPIGTACNGSLPVYRAAYIAKHYVTYETMLVQDVFVAVKFINVHKEAEAFSNLKREVDRNGSLDDHQNLIGIKKPFLDKGYFCVIFPLMEFGSLRSIMANRFPYGLPEDCIVLALKETLTALSFIHGNDQVHKEINAGHIFLNGKPELKLAFSASIYDEETDENQNQPSSSSSSSPYLPAATICSWAAAPEVYNSQNNEYYPPNSDIWLIGITALELACGGIKVKNRKALISMVKKINKKKRLPKKELQEAGNSNLKQELRFGKRVLVASCIFSFNVKKSAFSEDFEKIVSNCLALDPTKRPTADELLQHEIFAKSKDVVYFHNLLK